MFPFQELYGLKQGLFLIPTKKLIPFNCCIYIIFNQTHRFIMLNITKSSPTEYIIYGMKYNSVNEETEA